MTLNELLQAAHDAGISGSDTQLEHFATLISLVEREKCARICETAEVPLDISVWMGTKKDLTAATALGLAAIIRAQ